MKSIRVIVADNFSIVREGLCALLETQGDFTVVAQAVDGNDALAQAKRLHPDVLVMELGMPGTPWHLIIKRIKKSLPQTSVLVVTSHTETHFAVPTLRAGAHGFICKSQPSADFFAAVREVAQGRRFISNELARHLAMKSVGEEATGAPHEQLTPREQEVFLKLVRGEACSEIAAQLHISPKTVSTHKTRIFKKLELKDIFGLVHYALHHNLL